jgi:glucose-1-phosphate thymidylyltransferase
MKGVIACGGMGTRLYPITKVINKHLLPVYDKPMVYYPIKTLLNAGITDIMIVLGGPHAGQFYQVIGDGQIYNVPKLSYVFQDNVGGVGEAISLVEDFVENRPFVTILGDFICDGNISNAINEFKSGATLFLQKRHDTEGGVPVFDNNNKIISVEENPTEPKSDYFAQGLYIYDNKSFDYIREIRKSNGSSEIKPTHINNKYLDAGNLNWVYLNGFGIDSGKYDRMLIASNYFANKDKSEISSLVS